MIQVMVLPPYPGKREGQRNERRPTAPYPGLPPYRKFVYPRSVDLPSEAMQQALTALAPPHARAFRISVCSAALMVALADQARFCLLKGRHSHGRTPENQSIAGVAGNRAVNEGKGGIIRSESEL